MYKYDLHVHTSEVSACGKRTSQEIISDYAKLGFDGVVITDHLFQENFNKMGNLSWCDKIDLQLLGYKNAKKKGDELGVKVFLGIELDIPLPYKLELLVYGITEEFLKEHENFHLLSVEDMYELLVVRHGMLAFQAHPFRKGGYVLDSGIISGLEMINGGMSLEVNAEAYEHALKHNLPVIAASDNHDHRADLCGITTEEPIKNESELVQVLRSAGYSMFCNLPYPKDHPIWNHPMLRDYE